MNYCPNCGHKLLENSRFCPNCGISFTNKNVVLNSSNNDYLQNRSQHESGGSLAVVGIISFLFPIIGITLPFLSYGGSSLLSFMILIGLKLQLHHNLL